MSDVVSTSIRITTKTNRKTSFDESSTKDSSVYFIHEKRLSRSLDDLLNTEDDVVPIDEKQVHLLDSHTKTNVKSSAILSPDQFDVKEVENQDNSCMVQPTIKSELNLITNECFTYLAQSTPKRSHTVKSMVKQDLNGNNRLRLSSAGDVETMKAELNEVNDVNDVSTFVSPQIAASSDSLYENGKLYSKLAESDGTTLDVSSNGARSKPKKPKRSLQHHDREKTKIVKTFMSLNDITEPSYDLHDALNARIDEQNNVVISQEDFDKFIAREKTKYSGVVSKGSSFYLDNQIPFPLDDVDVVDCSFPSFPFHKSEPQLDRYKDSIRTYSLSLHKPSTKESAPAIPSKDSYKIKKIGAVLDSQIGELETLLSTSQSPTRSIEDIAEVDVFPPTSAEENIDRQLSGGSVGSTNETSFTSQSGTSRPVGRVQPWRYTNPSQRTELPDIPENEGTIFSKGIKGFRKSLKKARKRVVTKSGGKITLPVINRSFRIPKKFTRGSSENEVDKKTNTTDNKTSLHSVTYVYEGRKDNRTSKMLTIEYDKLKLTLDEERKQIEEERHRLSELKKQAAEKAEFEWQEKKREVERRETEEKEIETKKELLEKLKREQEMKAEEERRKIQEETEKMKRHEELLKQREKELAELHKERERREELERMLQNEKNNEHLLEQTLNEEKERLTTLEKSFAEERSKRLEIERRLHEEETRNRLINEEKKKPHDTRSNGTLSTGNNGTLKRRVPSYTLSLRSGHSSGNSEEINLLHNIQAAGHVVENCPSVKINRYSCRGYLLKMGKSKLKISWKKRWFVFDRKLRALCYYQDERKTKSKGILYFQSIQEVYVDSSIKRSPNPKTTFCVRTPQRTYVLSASSPVAMSIWIDVVCTGKEGVFSAMTL